MSSPSNGAMVSGTIAVSATASDNVGIAGVQFRLDGANLGAEERFAPYAISWDTTSASDGSHTLTAVARDAAGNTRTSAPVTITVSNAPPPPPPPPPADTTPPTVAIISPSSGTVSGTIAVSATASDNVGIAGVQFRLDGANLGAEERFAPYAISWDTTSASDGSHTLTAVARDAAGNTRTSAPVTITVSNGPPPPAPGTRFEETNPSITYTAGWDQGNATRTWSGGTAAVSFDEAVGAQATFTFTGTSVSWIGFRGPQAGIARVFLDGVLVAEVDTFSPTEEIREAVFTATGLADASHTLMIEETGLKNLASTNTTIVVDAFDVPAQTVTRFQETAPSITYTDGWAQSTSRPWSGGTATASTTAGAQATFTFTGTSVSWIGARAPASGIARVFLDGVLVAEVDGFSTTEEIQAVVFSATGLADASHTLMIEVTGLKSAAATNTFIAVDAFDVTP